LCCGLNSVKDPVAEISSGEHTIKNCVKFVSGNCWWCTSDDLVKATSCACGSSCFIWHNPESIHAFQLKQVQVLTLLGIFRKTALVAYYVNVVNILVRENPQRVMLVVVLLHLLKE
jgi:hypothetical protein